MPNSHIDDEKLSSLLNESEPPRSPKHLDESILSYARQQAEKNRQSVKVNKQSSSKMRWYRQSWVPATVTFSIAAIAVTVTLQNFGPEDFDRSVSELVSQPELALRDDLPVVVENTVEIRQRTPAQPSPIEPALENVQTQEDNFQLLQADDAVTSIMEADRITEVAEDLQQIAEQVNEMVAEPTALEDRANASAVALASPIPQIETPLSTTESTTEAEDEAVTPAEAGNNNSGASLAVTDTPATTITSGQSRRELPNQAPSVPPPQQSAAAQSLAADGTGERRQRDEENVSAAIATSAGIADATDIEKPELDNSPDDGVTANQNVEEVVVTSSFIRRPPLTGASVESAIAPTIADLAQRLRSDPDAQHDFLSLLEQSANQSNPDTTNSTPASRQPLSRSTSIFSGLLNRVVQTDSDDLAQRREQLIRIYERLGDPGQFLNMDNLYRQLLPEFPDLRAPETLETALELLELLNQ